MVNARPKGKLRPRAMAGAARLLNRSVDIEAATAALERYSTTKRRRPDFWCDADVRAGVFILHGEGIFTHEAVAALEKRFGSVRAPSRSALHRVWQLISVAKKAGWRLHERGL